MSVHRNIWLLALHNFCLDFRPYAAIAIVYFAQVTGSFALAMTVFATVMVSTAVCELPTGICSDMIGRRRSVIFGSAASVASLLCYAMGGSFLVLIVGACFEGLGRSFFSGNNQALLYDTLLEEQRTEDYPHLLGKTSSMFQFALAIGALLGAIFSTWSLQLVVWVSVAPQVCCLVVSFFFVEPKVHRQEHTSVFAHVKEALGQFRRNAKLRLLTVGSVIQFGVRESMFDFEPAFIASLWPTWAVATARIFTHLFGWLSFWLAGSVIRKRSALAVLFGALVISNILHFTAFGYPSVASPVLLASMSLLYGFIMVSESTLLQKEFTQEQRATMGSLNSLFGSLFFGLCAVTIGVVADAFSPTTALLLGETVLLALLPLYWKLFKH